MTTPSLNAEQRARLENLRADLEDLTAGADPSLPRPNIELDALTRLVLEGSSHATLPLRFLARCGLEPRPAETLSDAEIRSELWRLIWLLGLLRFFLRHTDHLDDRRLYSYLLDEGLSDPTALMPGEEDPPFFYVDPTSGPEPDSARERLEYFRDRLDEDDLRVTEARAGDEVPPLRTPAFDRDRQLP